MEKLDLGTVPPEIRNKIEALYYQNQAEKQGKVEKARQDMARENDIISKFQKTTAYHLPGAMRDTAKSGAKRALKKLKEKLSGSK
jgi:hypothetical protein